MGLIDGEAEYSYEASSTPIKLSLYNSFPTKKYEPPGMLTPPMRTLASIPFKWEEAPGKPIAVAGNIGRNSPPLKSKTVRCLVPPPPRLTTKVTNMPSPTTVLEGPYTGRVLSKSFTLSNNSSVKGTLIGRKERFSLSSWRWGSYKESSIEGSMDFSSSVGAFGVESISDSKVRMTRRRSSRFLSLSSTTSSNLLSSIYESLKQSVPWKRRQEKMRKMSL